MESAQTPPADGNAVHRRHGYTEREITRRLVAALFEQRFPPGSRVTENHLAEAYQVSRTLVRQSMNALAESGVFVKTPNLGYAVAAPTREEAGMMLDLRLTIEPETARRAARAATEGQIATLRDHIAREDAARRAQDRPTLLRLTGEFHLRLAEITGNRFLIRTMTELQILTSLAVLVHARSEQGCPRDEHRVIVRAVEGRDPEIAAQTMREHLLHVRAELGLGA